MSKKTRVALFLCLILAPVAVTALYVFGPHSETTFACSICGKHKLTKKRIAIAYYTNESETDDSLWYRAKGLRSHRHDWQYVCSNEKGWGRAAAHFDGFGLFLYPLHLLREAEQKTDLITFKQLIEEYYTTREDRSKIKVFVKHCKNIIASDSSFHSDG
jgi:hypothetical protein